MRVSFIGMAARYSGKGRTSSSFGGNSALNVWSAPAIWSAGTQILMFVLALSSSIEEDIMPTTSALSTGKIGDPLLPPLLQNVNRKAVRVSNREGVNATDYAA